MAMTLRRPGLLAALLACVALAACSPMKDPAEAAIADASAALKKIGPDAEQFAPTEYAAANEQINAMKAAFEKKDYEGVLNMVHKVAPSLKLLAETVTSKKGEAHTKLRDQWRHFSTDLPAAMTAVEARATELGKARKLPKGVSKEAVAGAGASLDAAKQAWTDAEGAKKAGNLEDAVAKGTVASTKLDEIKASLGIATPTAAGK
ncbi:MAG: hypothetical protein JSR54_05540 [Proteobacteria bacterium]|nr:hypothetical protein [Pseudomonadota bacterium]